MSPSARRVLVEITLLSIKGSVFMSPSARRVLVEIAEHSEGCRSMIVTLREEGVG